MKTLLFTAAFMTLTLGALGAANSAYACGTCNCKDAKMEKPCDKMKKAEKPCDKMKKDHSKMMSKYKDKENCAPCKDSERKHRLKQRTEIFFNE